MAKSHTIIVIVLGIILLTVTRVTNGQSWEAVAGGINGSVSSHTVLNNELYITGYSDSSSTLMKLENSTWTQLWQGNIGIIKIQAFNNEIYGLRTGSGYTLQVLKFNGTDWDTIGITDSLATTWNNSKMFPMCVFNNELYVGANFTMINNIQANYIAKWDGSNWSGVGSGLDGQPNILYPYGNELFVVGDFNFAGNLNTRHVAKWNGSDWFSLGSDLFPGIPELHITHYGGINAYHNDLFLLGDFFVHPPGIVIDSLMCFNWSNWIPVNPAPPSPMYGNYMVPYNNKLYFIRDGSSASSLQVYDELSWSTTTIVNNIIDTIYIEDVFTYNNELYVAGYMYADQWQSMPGIVKLVDPTLGTNFTIKPTQNIEIIPNPATDYLLIKMNDNSEARIQVQNLTGNVIFKSTYSDEEIKIPIQNWAKGVYFIEIQSPTNTTVSKIIKQ